MRWENSPSDAERKSVRAVLLPKAPSDFVTANRTVISVGDRVLPPAAI